MNEFERGVRAAADVLDGIQGSTGIREAQRLILALLPPVAPSGDRDLVSLIDDAIQDAMNRNVSWSTEVVQRLRDEGYTIAPAGDREAVAWPIEARRLLDAAQQAVIGFGMGWDMDGFIDSLRTQSEAATKLGVEPSQDHYPTALSRARTGSEAQS